MKKVKINKSDITYKNLKKRFNAASQDELLINVWEEFRRLKAITDTCGFCTDNIIYTKNIAFEDIKNVCENNNFNNS
jgi:hypothetical protein